MALSTPVSLFWVLATVSCLIVNAVEEEVLASLIPYGDVRQSKQMFAMHPPLYSYYNPYGAPIWIPTVQGEIHPESGVLFSGDSKSALTDRAARNEDISITPASTDMISCVFADCTTVAVLICIHPPTDCRFMASTLSSCMKSSTAVSGTISIQFSSAGAQIATVSMAPNKLLYSRVKITCTEITNGVGIYMKSGAADAVPSFAAPFTVTELKPVQIVILNTASATAKQADSPAYYMHIMWSLPYNQSQDQRFDWILYIAVAAVTGDLD
ncbi:hypothetical protein DAPPUDRAFT_99931 [Daphnia pulex]|uniref:Uncharacterized protein n=1 Tax=Daphnia pulex TaxID=6669 RepID=E9G8T3_DAPPU|nr:hypothetical protein DAPPUDRAFT_99931 [Daphnia pulex]|eukprot:EFX84029.1 hypothetical protein DAPPUDRAFT_99931 [Daphnia pulex]